MNKDRMIFNRDEHKSISNIVSMGLCPNISLSFFFKPNGYFINESSESQEEEVNPPSKKEQRLWQAYMQANCPNNLQIENKPN